MSIFDDIDFTTKREVDVIRIKDHCVFMNEDDIKNVPLQLACIDIVSGWRYNVPHGSMMLGLVSSDG